MTTACITGAASGMGRELASRLASRGVEVLALDRDEAGLKELKATTGGVDVATVDVTDEDAVAAQIAGTAWDHLVTAAGIGHTGRIDATTPAEHAKLMAVNYLGTVHTVHAALPAMTAARRGRVTIFASLAGWVPAPEHGPYGATKAALVMWSQALRRELVRSGVGVTCVCPSAVATPLLDDMPASKAGQRYLKPAAPEQVVEAVLKAVDRGRPWVFPREAKALQLLQRFAPHALERTTRWILRGP
ncbi:MAG: SDR family NAD(P)-dependent oxidoreductase [Acidimicrobiales bacterium]